MAVPKVQLSARVSKETLDQFNSIVNFYRSQIPLGNLSRSAVLEDVIAQTYQRMKTIQQQGGAKKIKAPSLK